MVTTWMPSSPLLFIIIVEGMSKALIQTKISGSFKGIKIGSNIFISHLLFVDDILFFCDGTMRDVSILKSC